MKKLLALALALAMMFALAVPAFAGGGYTIKKVNGNDAFSTTSTYDLGDVTKGGTIVLKFNANGVVANTENISVLKKTDSTNVTTSAIKSIDASTAATDGKITITLKNGLTNIDGGYAVNIPSSVTVDGNSLSQAYIIYFNVAADASSSMFSSATIDGNAFSTDVALKPTIKLTFTNNVSQDKDTFKAKETNKDQIVLLDKDGKEVEITLDFKNTEAEKNNIYLTPVEDLDYSSEYTIVIKKGLTAKNGSTLGEKKEIKFTTIAEPETTTVAEPTTTAATTTDKVADTADNSSAMGIVVMLSTSVVAMGAISATRKKED